MVEGVTRGLKAGWGVAGLAIIPLALCGCTTEEKVHQGELTQLLAVLPGTYDNSAQAEAEAHSGAHATHDAVTLTITHVFTPRLGHYVYYEQETAFGDPRRVLSEKMLSFDVDPKRGIVETLYQFVEPLRWRDGQKNKDLFTSLVVEDVQVEGCQLLWKHKDPGFVATHDPKVCPDPGGGATKIQAEISGGAFTIGDYKFRKSQL
jgi:CpeT/CpcT family (DUF1001)